MIGVAFRRYKLRRYLRSVVDTFSGVKRMKDFGKHLTWPTPPPAIEDFVEALKKMHRRCGAVRASRGGIYLGAGALPFLGGALKSYTPGHFSLLLFDYYFIIIII